MFLIQACRGKQTQEKVDVSNTLDQTSEHDECPEYSQSRSGTSSSSDDDCYTDGSTDIPKVPKDADIIVAFATTPGYLSFVFILDMKLLCNFDQPEKLIASNFQWYQTLIDHQNTNQP